MTSCDFSKLQTWQKIQNILQNSRSPPVIQLFNTNLKNRCSLSLLDSAMSNCIDVILYFIHSFWSNLMAIFCEHCRAWHCNNTGWLGLWFAISCWDPKVEVGKKLQILDQNTQTDSFKSCSSLRYCYSFLCYFSFISGICPSHIPLLCLKALW